MGASLLVRRDAIDAVGPPDSAFFLFSEETDWCYRFHQAGWSVVFHPAAEVVHVSGAAHGGRMFKENVRSHLRFFAKHHGAREADRARRLMLWALRFRGLVFRGDRRRMYRGSSRRGSPPAPRPSSSTSLVELRRLTRPLALGAARAARAGPRPRVPGDGRRPLPPAGRRDGSASSSPARSWRVRSDSSPSSRRSPGASPG